MSKIIIASALTALVASAHGAANNLRAAPESENEGRNLQVADQLKNSLLTVLTPLIAEYIEDELTYYDPIAFPNVTTIDLGNSTFEGTCPDSSANLTYGFGAVTGLSNINIDGIELVPGSDDITVSFLALDGATWEGDWIFTFNWPSIVAETSVQLQANLCGFPIDQTISGLATVLDANVVAKASMFGKTGNVLRFRPTSEVTSIVLQTVELNVGNVTADVGVAGSVIQNINLVESLEQKILTQFADDIEPFIVNVVNAYFETNAPFPLAEGATTGVSKSGSP